MADYTLSAKITGDASGLQQAFSTAQKNLDEFGKKMESAGKKWMPITGAITGVGVASGKMALDFEDSIANINTLLDDTTNLESYKSSIMDLSDQTGISAGIMSSGMYQAISSLGDGGKETEKIFGTMAKSAKAGGAEVADSVALISAGMKGYDSINDETAQRISDLAFQTAKLGVTTFPEMAKSMQPLFPLSNSLNLSYEELFGSMATLTGVTGNTAEVSTQLKAVLGGLMTPTSSMEKLLDKYGYANGAAMIKSEGLAGTLKILQDETGGQSDKLAELFGSQEAIVAMTALTGSQFDTFNEKLEAMGTATGATEAAYAKLDTSGDKIRNSLNKIKNTAIDLGSSMIDMLAPSIESASDKISEFAKWFTGLDDNTKKTIITVAGLVAAIGPLLIIGGKISSGISSIMGLAGKLSGLCSPIGLIVAAVAALAAGFAYLMSTNSEFKDSVMSAWGGVKETISGVINAILPVIQNLVSQIGPLFASITETVGNVFTQLAPIITDVISNIAPALTSVFGVIGDVVGAIAEAFNGFFSGLQNGFSSNLGGAAGFATGISGAFGGIGPVIEMIVGLFQQFLPQIQTLASTIGSALVPVFTTLGQTIGSIAASVLPALMSIISNLVPVLMNIFSTAMQIINAVLPVVISLIQQLAPFIAQIVDVISQLMASLAPVIAQLINSLLPVITNIVTVIMNVVTAVMPAVISIMNVIMSIIKTVVPIISDILSVVISVVSGILSAISPIVSFIGGVITAIVSVIAPIVTFIADIIAVIIEVIGTIIGVVTGIFSTVFSVISNVWTSISNYISAVINAVSSVIASISGTVSKVFNGIYNVVSKIMTNVRNFISGVFNGIKSAWNGLTSFVSGIFSGIAGAVEKLVSKVKGFVNGVIGGVNAAIGIINKIPGVNIGMIPYLLHGTDDWAGGFARMNEGGRGELTYLPDGTQVIPHDISVQYAKEAARANQGNVVEIDYARLITGITESMRNVSVRHVTSLNGKTLADEITPLMDTGMGQRERMVGRMAY